MKKYILTYIILVFAYTAIQAQNNEWKHNQIKFSPLRTLNSYAPGLELSYQRNYGRFASQITGAYVTDVFGIDVRENIRGYRYGFEQKYFIVPKRVRMAKIMNAFFSVGFNYDDLHQDISSLTFVPIKNGERDYENSYITDCILLNKWLSVNIRYGMEFHFKNLILEWGAGIGVSNKNNQYLNKKNPTDERDSRGYEGFIPFLFIENEGKYTTINIPVSLKVGYSF
ncbi:MAG: hypothetical protein LBE91_15770 [Tannerella sp.]|jgi:hypothetical protein|nr:hypothetical protein [Tannerella sp.]